MTNGIRPCVDRGSRDSEEGEWYSELHGARRIIVVVVVVVVVIGW